MKTPPRVSLAQVVAKRSARPCQASKQRRTLPRKKAPEKRHPHEPAASESTELTQERAKVKCCGVELKAHCPVARYRHRKRFPECRRYGVETGGREMVHANSPMKRLDWQRECTRKRTEKYRAAKKGKVSAKERPGTISISDVIE